MIQTRHRSGAIVSPPTRENTRQNQTSPLPPSFSSSSSPNSIHNNMNSVQYPRNSSDLHTHSRTRTNSSSNSSNSTFSSYNNSTNSIPYSSQQPQQTRPPSAALRPSSGNGAGTRLRSGSNPISYKDSAIGSTISALENLHTQRQTYRESSNSSNAGTGTGSGRIANNDAQGTLDTYSRPSLSETGDRLRVSPVQSTGVPRNRGGGSPSGNGPRTRAASSSGYYAREQSNIIANAISGLSERPSNALQFARERSSGASSSNGDILLSASKSTSPIPRMHSHSVSVPSVSSNFSSSQKFTSSSTSTPPPPRYSTKPITPVGHSNSNLPASSIVTSNSQGNPSIPTTSAVDLAGKRLREQQLQDRKKAAQSFIERTVGSPLPSNDLHEALKDGIILCNLVNKLRPATVLQISKRNPAFFKMENIENFLIAARQLGVQSSDLFQTVDLFEAKDMTQVISTILTLERVVGGAARIANKKLDPNPRSSEDSPTSRLSQSEVSNRPILARMRSKTAHTPSVASTATSIRPSDSTYYAEQVRKLEEDSIRFATGYDRQEANGFKQKDPRHQSTPVISKNPSLSGDRITRLPSLNDMSSAIVNNRFGGDQSASIQQEALHRREQRDLVFGSSLSSTSEHSTSIPRSASGPLLPTEIHLSALDTTKRRKKSISLDPQAANAVMGSGYKNGLSSPGSPGMTQSTSHNAVSSLKQHIRYSSDKAIDAITNRSAIGSPSSSRSPTPVQGFRRSTNNFEPLREKLELVENYTLMATYQLGNCIGRGQFASVYKALNLVTGQVVAVKRIKIDGLNDDERDMLMQEVDLLKSLVHPSIVKYEGFIKTDEYLNIILEFAENGSLLTLLKSFGTFPEKLVVAYVVKILEGLVYLHGKEVVHCDLKAANILTTKNGNVKLSDFGVSLNLKVKESDFGAVAGTPNWMAPEVIELKGASPASDIWSLGCTIIEMLTGRPPYADLLAMTTLFRIVEDERPPLPNNLSVDLLDFLCQCFQKNPSLRPSAGALGRHNWIKRNFTAKELKPMDSLPFMRRKLMEPKDKSVAALAVGENGGNATRRALTPLGISIGAPPPAASATTMLNVNGRGGRRGSVDSASAYYPSSTVPTPTNIPERPRDVNREVNDANRHQFVKSSFAKPVECKYCHDYVKKQAVICQDCSMSPTPAQSVPNLKLLTNGKPKGCSRPNSRASQLTQDDRPRSITPSQGPPPAPSRLCPTPPLPVFTKRETTTINENAEQRRVVSPQPPVLPQRAMSPEDNRTQTEQRPSSRQAESPTSPTFSGLRNFIAGPRRFSFGKKNTQPQGASNQSSTHSLPTPPMSVASASPLMNTRHNVETPDSGKVQRQPPTTPPKPIPVPIAGKRGGSGPTGRGREYMLGPLDTDDDDGSNGYRYSRSHQRPSAISIFSTSAPPVNSEYLSGRRSVGSVSFSDEDCREVDKEDSDEEVHSEVDNVDEEDIEALLVPSGIRTPRSSIDAGKPVVAVNGGGQYRVKSPSFGQVLSQQPNNQDFSGGRPDSTNPASKSNPTVSFESAFGRSPIQQHLNNYPLRAHPNGYNSSGSSSAALTSSFSSQSNNSSSVSSLGSVAALLEEEDRMNGEGRRQEKAHSDGVSKGNQVKNGMLGVPQSQHVSVLTMFNRLSASNKDQNASGNLNDHLVSQGKEQRSLKPPAYGSAPITVKHQIQLPTQYQNQNSQSRSIHPLEQQQRSYQQQPYQPSNRGKLEFSPGYDHDRDGASNVKAGLRASSPGGRTNYSRVSTNTPSPSPYSGFVTNNTFNNNNNNNNNNTITNSATSALKRGGKVIRRSVGVTLEKERWE
ncbi:hypothetical protein BGZ76_008200 [Entomortierella beljakovae]|nr:hypothetical protein BGZ76_008200 [Entomortierella beljakovae]